jgi:hypothetical protein
VIGIVLAYYFDMDEKTCMTFIARTLFYEHVNSPICAYDVTMIMR